MWTKARALLLAVVVATGTATLGPGPATAIPGTGFEIYDPITHFLLVLKLVLGGGLGPAGADSQAAVAEPQAAVFHLVNVAATLEPGEPAEGGRMTRTVWAGFKAPAAERIVIHTFGSQIWTGSNVFDTVLAVYRGTAISNLTRIAGDDNTALAGTGDKHSLVQFNTVAGADYRVQIGSRAQAEGDVSLSVFRFPPAGGLSAFLFHYGVHTVNAFNSRDYTCDFYTGQSVACDAKFIVHNSTSQTLTVTSSSTLGSGVVAAPASFSLAPGALRVVNFTFGPAFNRTTVRTVSGHFIFTGRTGSTIVSKARHRALVVARASTPITDLVKSVAAGPTVQTGHVNEPFAVTSTIINSGAQTAIGCHFRSVLYSYFKTTFYRIDPATKRLSADNVPLNIPAGQSRTFKVTLASQLARDADYIDPEVIADCANNYRYLWGLRSGFDISTTGYAAPLPSIAVTSSKPSNDVLNVPAAGFAYYTFRATNRTTTEPLRVLPYYQNPFEDPANTDFTVAICRTNVTTGTCLGAYAGSVTYTPTKNTVFAFSVRVKAPAAAPAFNPDKRRVYVDFKLAGSPFILIAAPSIAVRKQ